MTLCSAHVSRCRCCIADGTLTVRGQSLGNIHPASPRMTTPTISQAASPACRPLSPRLLLAGRLQGPGSTSVLGAGGVRRPPCFSLFAPECGGGTKLRGLRVSWIHVLAVGGPSLGAHQVLITQQGLALSLAQSRRAHSHAHHAATALSTPYDITGHLLQPVPRPLVVLRFRISRSHCRPDKATSRSQSVRRETARCQRCLRYRCRCDILMNNHNAEFWFRQYRRICPICGE